MVELAHSLEILSYGILDKTRKKHRVIQFTDKKTQILQSKGFK